MNDMRKLNCGRCDYSLAFTDEKQTYVSLRYMELYFKFFGGLIKIICKGCGQENLIIDTVFEEANADFVKAEKAKGGVLAIVKPWVSRDEFENKGNRHYGGRSPRYSPRPS
jgi:hypothetical protein